VRNAAEITAEDYKKAFLALESEKRISDNQSTMLRTHYRAPDQVITAHQLAETVGYKDYHGANLWYGKLAKLVAEEVEYQPPEGYTFLSTLVTFVKVDTPYPMKLRPNVAKALEEMGWV
jgi:hypothetical protein